MDGPSGSSPTVEPVPGTEGTYHLTPGSVVGAAEIDGLSVIRVRCPGRLHISKQRIGKDIQSFSQTRTGFGTWDHTTSW